MIAERTIDLRGEWRNFSESDKNRSRAAAVDDLNPELSTNIQSIAFSKNKNLTDRMGKIQNRNANNARDQDINDAYEKIIHYSKKMNLTEDIIRRAKKLYLSFNESLAKDKKLSMKGKKSEPMIVAILYHALRLCRVGRTIAEVSDQVGIDKKTLGKMTRRVADALKNTDEMNSVDSVNPDELLHRFCSYLKANYEIEELATKIVRFIVGYLEGKKPETIAAVAIVMASNLLKKDISEKNVSEVAYVTPATIKNTYKDVEYLLGTIEEQFMKKK